MAESPTSRTLNWLKKQGMIAGVVERYNSHTKRKNDLFGFIDVVAIAGGATIGVQATSADHVADRASKIINECPHAVTWLNAENFIWVVGWSKKGKAGKRKLWTPTVREIVLQGEQLAVLE